MKKSLLRSLLILAIVAVMVAGPAMTVFADDTAEANKKMAYNIYADPDVSKTSKKYITFSIDFYSDETPINTYWSLANFGLDLSSKKNFLKFPAISGGGAYAGLQERGDGSKVSIMAFWEMPYGGTKIHNVKRMYPAGDSNFGGEGEGKNCIAPYAWTDANWYRMVLHTWDDVETGTTFVGQWVQDLSTGEWHLACYFDTGLYESCLIGGMGLFMENYWAGLNQWTNVRSFRTKNIYVNDKKDGLWKSLNTVNISYGNGGADNKMGAHSFGVSEDGTYFWGSSGGLVEGQGDGVYVDPQKAYEQTAVKSKKLSITQPDQPTFGTPSLTTLTLEGNTISWELSKTNTPQLSYKLEITDKDGNTLVTKEESRPQISSVTLEELTTDAYKATLTVTDLFGSTTTLEKTTEAYDKAPATPTPEPTPEDTKAPETTAPATTPDETATEAPDNAGVIVAIVAGVIVVAGIAVFFIIKKKNK